MTKIMLVEDDKSLREIYGIRLLAEGYEITSAGDGEEALALAVKEHPDLIISDVMMPKISGFDMLDILRATPETKNIKIIMMTALSSEDQRARGESLGANRYLVKSQVGIEDVIKTVHDVLADNNATASVPAMFDQTIAPTAFETQPAPVAPVAAPAAPVTPVAATMAPAAPVVNVAAPVMSTAIPVTPAPQPVISPAETAAPAPVEYAPTPAQPTINDIAAQMNQELSQLSAVPTEIPAQPVVPSDPNQTI